MDKKTLDKGNELLNEITAIKEQQGIWNNAESIHSLQVNLKNSNATTPELNRDFIDFEAVKSAAGSKLSERLSQLEAEFEALGENEPDEESKSAKSKGGK